MVSFQYGAVCAGRALIRVHPPTDLRLLPQESVARRTRIDLSSTLSAPAFRLALRYIYTGELAMAVDSGDASSMIQGEQQGASSSKGTSGLALERSEAGIALLMDILRVADYFECAPI